MVDLQIGLVLIDEVHLLSENRGAALEAGCLSRIRMVASSPHMQNVRLWPIPPCMLTIKLPLAPHYDAWCLRHQGLRTQFVPCTPSISLSPALYRQKVIGYPLN